MATRRLTRETKLKATRKTATLRNGQQIKILHYGGDYYDPTTMLLLADPVAADIVDMSAAQDEGEG